MIYILFSLKASISLSQSVSLANLKLYAYLLMRIWQPKYKTNALLYYYICIHFVHEQELVYITIFIFILVCIVVFSSYTISQSIQFAFVFEDFLWIHWVIIELLLLLLLLLILLSELCLFWASSLKFYSSPMILYFVHILL